MSLKNYLVTLLIIIFFLKMIAFVYFPTRCEVANQINLIIVVVEPIDSELSCEQLIMKVKKCICCSLHLITQDHHLKD